MNFHRYCPPDRPPRTIDKLSEAELVNLINSGVEVTVNNGGNDTEESVMEQLRITLSLKQQGLL